jgi:transcriptional regulator with XRE-family HTH domain
MAEPPGYIVAQRVRARRRHLGWTQEELAQRCGLRQSAIARVEAGKSKNIETRTLIALADALDVSIDALVGREDLPEDRAPTGTSEPDPPAVTPEAPPPAPRRGKWRLSSLLGAHA